MAEKATLLNKLPPVAKRSETGEVTASSTETSGSTARGSSGRDTSTDQARSVDTRQTIDELSLLTRKLSAPKSSQREERSGSGESTKAEPAPKEKVAAQTEAEVPATATTASTAQPAEVAAGISMLQVASYASFVLTFILAGFAAVVLFRKAAKVAEQRFVVSAKLLGGALALAGMHGFFATFLYTSFLRNDASNAPLALTGAIWIVLGAAVGVIVNHLLTPRNKPKMGAVAGDVIAYVCLFGLMTVSLSGGISANTAIILSLLSGLLLIVPVVRATIGLKIAKVRHPELKRTPEQALLYSLLFIPALAPILAFLHACGAFGADVTLLLLNFMTFDFILIGAIAMMVSADDIREQAEEETAAGQARRSPEPVVEFSGSKPAPSGLKPKKVPPRKPGRPGDQRRPEPPKKPNRAAPKSDEDDAPAPNAPSRVRAPAKPKKRF